MCQRLNTLPSERGENGTNVVVLLCGGRLGIFGKAGKEVAGIKCNTNDSGQLLASYREGLV